MGLAEFGRKELTLAEIEMPGLMESRKEFGPSQPFKARHLLDNLEESRGHEKVVFLPHIAIEGVLARRK